MTRRPRHLFITAMLAVLFAWAEAAALPPTDYPPGGGKENIPGTGSGDRKEGTKEAGGKKGDKKGANKGDKKGGGKKGGDKSAKNGNGKGKGKGKGDPDAPPFEVTTGVVLRTPTTRTAAGEPRPPWKQVDIAKVGLRGEAEKGKRATVVPFSEKTEAFQLPIIEARKRNTCAATGKPWWAITLAPARQSALRGVRPNRYRDADKPIDAAVIYPAQEKALFIEPLLIPKSDIPDKFLPKTLVGGVDLNDDGKADLMFLEYCCRDRTKTVPECLATCTRVYWLKKDKKTKKESWKLIGRLAPC
ncbi:MAG TPA: hypothetical protein VM325_08670 [Alphaproteobacteria bacterium]|nr:hypothetical protein [Alphaproteobacteria bacterium]